MFARKGITLLLHEDKEFLIYVHDKGEEFYLHYDFWPNVPFIHHSVPSEYFADVEVKKQLEVQSENCDHQSYDYFGMYNYLFCHIIGYSYLCYFIIYDVI